MIETDGGDDGHVGVDHVDGVEPAAQPDFEQQDLWRDPGRELQRGQRPELEIGERSIAAGLVNRGEGFEQGGVFTEIFEDTVLSLPVATPEAVCAGDQAVVSFEIRNDGTDLASVQLSLEVVQAATGTVVAEHPARTTACASRPS